MLRWGLEFGLGAGVGPWSGGGGWRSWLADVARSLVVLIASIRPVPQYRWHPAWKMVLPGYGVVIVVVRRLAGDLGDVVAQAVFAHGLAPVLIWKSSKVAGCMRWVPDSHSCQRRVVLWTSRAACSWLRQALTRASGWPVAWGWTRPCGRPRLQGGWGHGAGLVVTWAVMLRNGVEPPRVGPVATAMAWVPIVPSCFQVSRLAWIRRWPAASTAALASGPRCCAPAGDRSV